MGNAHCGFKNFHYCLRTANAVPVPMPGAVRLTREPDMQELKIVPNVIGKPTEYVSAYIDKGIKLGLEIVSLPVSFLTDVLGYTIDANGVLVENEHPAVHFALLYETHMTSGDMIRHSYLDCVCRKPRFDASTLSGSSRIETRSLELVANRDIFGSRAIKKSIAKETNAAVFNSWFSALYRGR